MKRIRGLSHFTDWTRIDHSDIDSADMGTSTLHARSFSTMADEDMAKLLPRQLGQFNNMSGLEYDKYVMSLPTSETGCLQQGALPVPLAENDTCHAGWYCE